MKTKLTLTFLLSFIFGLWSSYAQVPQGFNYQAIARDGSGNILQNTDLQVMLYIQSLSTGGTIFWKELHNPVTTNSFGLFTIVVGTGVRQTASTVATFDLIDWKVTPKYLKTEIYYSGSWKNMGDATQLYAVPYAMTARDLAGAEKLNIKGTTSDLEEPLFEVKNKDSQTIFAVYNEGVRIWVADGSKGTKGGFAVGGFDMTKGTTGNYFNVSARSEADTINGESRVMWYPVKEAFRSGNVLIESKDSVGLNSWASGYRSKAIGDYSQALGYQAIARGDYSTAIGKNAVANNNNSFAFGNSASALNNQTYAFGNGAKAYALGSFALGYNSRASGQDAFALGSGSEASGLGSFAIGFIGRDSAGTSTSNTKAVNDYAVAIGSGAQANNKGSFSIGTATTANSDFGLAVGYKSAVSGFGSIALGYNAISSGDRSLALGYYAKATNKGAIALNYGIAGGEYSISMGYSNQATANGSISLGGRYFLRTPGNIQEIYITRAQGVNSIALGQGVIALGINSCIIGTGTNFMQPVFNTNLGQARADYSMCFGTNVVATGQYATAMGYSTEAQSFKSFVIGTYNVASGNTGSWVGTDPLFIIGNGTSASARSNAFVVNKDGNASLQGSLQIGSSYGPITHNWWEFGTDNNNGTAIDFHSNSSPSDFSARVFRQPGNDGIFEITNLGNGELRLQAQSGKVVMPYLPGTTSGSTLRIYNDQIYYYSSSLKNKTEIVPLDEDFNKILQAQPVKFTDKISGERNIGYIAEDFDEKGLQNLVIYKDGEPISLSYELISLYNLEIIKDQQKAIREQQQQIESQQKQIDELKAMVEKLIVR